MKSRPKGLQGFPASVGVGAVWAAVSIAVVSPLFALSDDNTSHKASAAGIAGFVAICVCALLLLAAATRRSGRAALANFFGLVAVGAGAWGLWEVRGCFKPRGVLPLVADSSGANVIAAAAMTAAAAAAVMSLIISFVLRQADARTALCAFLVVLLAVTALMNQVLKDYRARLWHPEITAAAAPAASLPDGLGPARYRLALPDKYTPYNVLAAGNGFIVPTGDKVSAYDGPTGALRWRADGFGQNRLSAVEVVRRDRQDVAEIVVLFFDGPVVALDGSSGAVLWRRDYRGRVTASSASADALGMTVYDDRATPDNRTMAYSLEPSTGELRWRKTFSCSDPAGTEGVFGQLVFKCEGSVSVVDAHNGNAISLPAPKWYDFAAGGDVYLAWQHNARSEGPDAGSEIFVIDSHGKIVDQVPGAYAMSRPDNGRLLLYDGRDSWTLRDYDRRQSTPVPMHYVEHPRLLSKLPTAWLQHRLVFYVPDEQQPLLVIDPVSLTTEPVSVETTCPLRDAIRGLQAVAGAVIAECGENELVGLVSTAI